MRKITETISLHRPQNDLIARTLNAAASAIVGPRAQLRYLQCAENVAKNALFPGIVGDDESDEISTRPSMFGHESYGEEQADVNEAVLSLLTVQSTMLASQSAMLMVNCFKLFVLRII